MNIALRVEQIFREEHGRILAGLIRIAGSIDAAEDALQEALTLALSTWPERGIPPNPAAWIALTARRKVLDDLRHQRIVREKEPLLQIHVETNVAEAQWDEMPLPDQRLKLIFTCCHPALNREAQVALTLRTLGGLTTEEIAKAFLVDEPALAQRIVRAKRKIREARIPYQVPAPEQLPARLNSVRAVIYLIFNEGYAAHASDLLVRTDLCAEAIRLARVLNALLPGDPESMALLALMLLHDARRAARVCNGELVTIEEQDRRLWNRAQIAQGLELLESIPREHEPGAYELQAKIAALHAKAERAGVTDWRGIARLYGELLRLQNSPVVALNRAAALSMAGHLEQALAEMDVLVPRIESYYLLHAARADVLRRMGRTAEARTSYERALALVTNAVEQRFLERRLTELREG